LRSSVTSVAAVYTTLRRQSARFRSCSPASSPSTLHVPWASTSSCTEPRFQEPSLSCFLVVFYAKLSQSSTRVWLVILTSVRFPVGTGQDAELQKLRGRPAPGLYLLQTNTMKTLQSTPPTPVRGVPYTWTLQSTTGTPRPFSINSLSTTSSHGLMLARDSKS